MSHRVEVMNKSGLRRWRRLVGATLLGLLPLLLSSGASARQISDTLLFPNENQAGGTVVGQVNNVGFLPGPPFFPSPTVNILFNLNGTFQLNATSLNVSVLNPGTLDAEFATYDLIVLDHNDIFDGYTFAFVDIFIQDLNDNLLSAVTDTNGGANRILEGSGSGVSVNVTAFASDDDVSANISYSLVSNPGNHFQINSGSGVITTTSTPTDYEANTSITVRVRATENFHGESKERNVTINVDDADDFPLSAVSDDNGAANAVNENSLVGKEVGLTALASDGDGSADIEYSLVSNPGNHFQIDSNTGVVTTSSTPLDREANASITIRVRATETTHGQSDESNFVVAINDVNDNAISAVTDANPGANGVDENRAAGRRVNVRASASDSDVTSAIVYSLTSNPGGHFSIDGAGEVRTSATPIDYELTPSITIQVEARDTTHGDASVEDFVITIADLDDNVLSAVSDDDGAANSFPEESLVDTAVNLTGNATDADGTANITYALTSNPGGHFKIDATTGVVTTTATPVDFETNTSVTVRVEATENTHGASTNADFVINVVDVDETALTLVGDSDGTANTVPESAGADQLVGVTAFASDADASAVITYAITSNPGGHFKIDTNTGVVTTTNTPTDHEATPTVTLHIEATENSTGDQTDADFVITIGDLNDNPLSVVSDADAGPDFVAENSPVDTAVNVTGLATDADGTASMQYSLAANPGGFFKIDPISGAVTTTATPLDYESATTASITIRATETTHGDTADLVVVVNVGDVNDLAPVFTSSAVPVVVENTTAVVTATTTDVDTVGPAHTYTVSGGLDAALFSIGLNTGDLVFDSAPNFEGPLDAGTNNTYDVEITASDGVNATIQALAIVVTGINEAPIVAAAATETATEDDAGYTFSLLTNASDADAGDTVTVSNLVLQSGDASGITPAGDDLNIAPSAYDALAAGESEEIVYTYDVEDTGGLTTAQTATITITGVNDGPSGNPDVGTPDEDNLYIVAAQGPLGNDTDPDTNDVLAVKSVEGSAANVGSQFALGSGALLTVNADGSYEYDPNGQFDSLNVGQTANDSFVYIATDGNGGDTASNTVSLMITGLNDLPVAVADGGSVDENAVLNVAASGLLSNDTDADTTSTLSVKSVEGSAANVGTEITLGSGALLTVNSDGSLTYDPNGQFESLAVGQSQGDPFQYVVTDGEGGDSAPGTATPLVQGENDAPAAADNTLAVDEDVAYSFQESDFGFTDIDNGDTLEHITLTILPVLGDLFLSGVPVTGGDDITAAQIPNLTYLADPDDDGPGYATFDFLVFDGDEDSASQYTITLDVTGVADAPSVSAAANPNTDEDTAFNLGLSASLNDSTNETLTVVISGLPVGASLTDGINSSSAASVDVSTWTLANIEVTPPLHDTSPFTLTTTATATETLSGDTEASVAVSNVTLDGVADLPGVVFGLASGDEDAAITLPITVTPVDTTEVLTYELTGVSGTLNVGTDNGGGSWSLSNADVLGGVTVTPPEHDSAPFVVDVTVTSTDGASSIDADGSIPVTVNPVADAPTLTVLDTEGLEDTAISLSIVGALVDPSETLSYELTGVNGTLSAGVDNGGGSWSLTAADAASLTVTPELNNTVDFTINVSADSTDSGDVASNTDTIFVDITAVNDAPTFADVAFTVPENSPNGTVVGTGVGVDVEGSGLAYATGSSVFAIDPASGVITVTDVTALDFEVSPSLSLTVNVTDDGGLSGSGTVVVNLSPVNDNNVVAVADTPDIDEGAVLTYNVLDNDLDADVGGDPLTVTEVNGSAGLVGIPIDLEVGGVVAGELTILSDGSTTFDTTDDVTVEIFAVNATYTVNDGGTSSTTTLDIAINPQNDNAPTLTAAGLAVNGGVLETWDEDEYTNPGAPNIIPLNGTGTEFFMDYDIDPDGLLDGDTAADRDTLTFSISGNSNGAVVNAVLSAGDLQVTSGDNRHGTATLTIEGVDSALPAAHPPTTLTFDLVVQSVNDAPIYQIGSYADSNVNEDAPATPLQLASAFSDADLLDLDPTDEQLTYTITIEDRPNDFVQTGVIDETNLPVDNIVLLPGGGLGGAARRLTVITTDPFVNLELNDDAHGTLDVTVRASDQGMPPNAPPLELFDERSFRITVQAVGDDSPAVTDDHYSTNPQLVVEEDGDPIIVDVSLNDYQGDAPSTVISAGQTIEDNLGLFHSWRSGTRLADPNNTGDFEEVINGEVSCAHIGCLAAQTGDTTVDGAPLTQFAIIYKPLLDFNGEDTFTYCIEDSESGGEGPIVDSSTDPRCGEVTVNVTPTNDKPVPNSPVVFVMDQADVLTLDASEGLRTQVVDVDNTHMDGSGCNPLDPGCASDYDTLVFELIDIVTAHGVVFPFGIDGSFTYKPDPRFAGEDSFRFNVCDVPLPGTAANCEYDVTAYITVEALEGAPEGSSDEVVQFDYQLAQNPLELPIGPEPNVLVVNDDSGSMQWDILTNQSSGLYYFSTGNYIYYTTKASAGTSTYVAPSEEAVPNQGLWRLRSPDYNSVYYNPGIRYEPWEGLDSSDTEFPESPPSAARHNPLTALTTNLTQTQTYTGRAVTTSPENCEDVCLFFLFDSCWWEVEICTGGSGFQQVVVNNYYIPRYYRWTDRNSNGQLDATPSPFLDADNSEGELVEIVSGTNYPKAADRSDCETLPAECTYEEELQNFANWFTYARDRESTAKTALGKVISTAENIRVGYAVLNNDAHDIEIKSMNTSDRTGEKADLLDQIYQTSSGGGTPLRNALRDAGRHYECRADDIFESGANSNPGDAGCPILAAPDGNCQQNFTLLITDGSWNGDSPGVGNTDGDNSTNFDGNLFAGSYSNSLADVAMYYYERDLHNGLSNEVPTTGRDRGSAADTAFTNGDNVIMHQHMATYTVGFGVVGEITSVPTDYTQSFVWGDPTTSARKIDDLWHAATNGRGEYLNANNAKTLSDALIAAFEEFAQGSGAASAVSFNSQEIQEDTLIFRAFYNTNLNTGDLVAQALTDDGLADDFEWRSAEEMDNKPATLRQIFTYDAEQGYGIPFRHDSLNDGQRAALAVDPLNPIDDDIEDRVNYLRGDRSLERPVGSFRERPTIEGALGDVVHATPVFIGAPAGGNRASLPYPQSKPYSTFAGFPNNARQRTIYVAANDGMLHGFNAVNGEEMFGFVPNNLLTSAFSRKITELLNYEYSHKFLVDLTPAINDIFIDPDPSDIDTTREWATVLVGGHGAGAKAYFALNITDPSKLVEASADEVVLWEFTEEHDTYPTAGGVPLTNTDLTQRQDLQVPKRPVKDLGYSFSVPTLAMSNVVGSDGEQEWVAVLGNGYNSTAGIAKLFVLFINRGIDGNWCHPDMIYNESLTPSVLPAECIGKQDFVKLNTGAGVKDGFPNGLGTPRAIDIDFNGTVDYAYAGDTFGNLYRFDLTSSSISDWSVERIFQATHTEGGVETEQPITTQPIVTRNPIDDQGFIVIFATGSYITIPDGSSDGVQSIYGIWDRLVPGLIDKNELVRQEYTNRFSAEFGNVRSLTNNVVDYTTDGAAHLGWYNDLNAPAVGGTAGVDPPQFPGERAIRNIQLRAGIAFVNSVIPRSATSCVDIAGGFALSFCPTSGGTDCLLGEVFDLNNDLFFDDEDQVDGNTVLGLRFEDAVPTDSSFIEEKRVTQLSDKSLDMTTTNTATNASVGRLSWKQLQTVPQ